MSRTIETSFQNLPNFHIVELPCLIRNEETALDCIGGVSSANEFLNHDTSMLFRFPGDNPLRSTLEGSVLTNAKVLFRLKRRKNKKTGQIISQSTEVLGVIRKTVVFNNPADYQFLPASTRLDDYVAQINNPSSTIPFEIVPESICRVEHNKRPPQVLHFLNKHKLVQKGSLAPTNEGEDESQDEKVDEEGEKDMKTSKDEIEAENAEDGRESTPQNPTNSSSKRKKDEFSTVEGEASAVIIKLGDPIPSIHPLGDHPPRWAKSFSGFQLLEKLRKIFKILPILSKKLLIELLGLGTKLHQFRETLLFAAYSYSNGPFQHLWVRYGYDPAADPTSRIYQQLVCKLHPKFLTEISNSLSGFLGKDRSFRKSVDLDKKALTDLPSEFSHSFIDKGADARMPVLLFGNVLKRQMTIELCRCTLEETFEFMKKVSVMNTFHHQTGWFSSQTLDALRSYFIELISKLTKEYTQLNDIPFQPGPSTAYDPYYFDKTWPKIEEFLSIPNPDFSQIEIDYPDIPVAIIWLRRYQLFADINTEVVERKAPKTPVSTRTPKRVDDAEERETVESEFLLANQKQQEEVKAFQFFNDSDSEASY